MTPAAASSALGACLILLALPWTGACSAAESPPAGRAVAEETVEDALRQLDFAEAERLIGAQLELSPNDPDWLLWRADLNVRRGKPELALTQVRNIIQTDPLHRRSRRREAQLLSLLGRLRTASDAYGTYLRDFPEDLDGEIGLALCRFWCGNYPVAAAALDRVLARQPDHETAFYAWLRCLIGAGRISEAMAAAQDRDRRTEGHDAELGLIIATLADRAGARAWAETLASRPTLDPDLERRQLAFRALQRIRAGEHEGGLTLVQAFAGKNPYDYEAWVDAGDLYAAADQRTAALACYRQAAQLTPERAEARLGLARLASREGRLAGSLALYQQIVEANPEAFEAWLGVIRTALLMRDLTAAQIALEQAQRLDPKSAALYQEEILIALQSADMARFVATLERYLEDHPRDRTAALWEQRWRQVAAQNPDRAALLALADPWSPQITALALHVWLADGGRLEDYLAAMPPLPDPDIRIATLETLATQLALHLERDAARAVAAQLPPERALRVQVTTEGWWACLSTPWAHGAELTRDFDPQALNLWLADQIQRRIRWLYVETETPLRDEWLLRQADWFTRWQNRWGSDEAARALASSIEQLGDGWNQPIRLEHLEEAWRTSEQHPPSASGAYGLLQARARWREGRNELSGAIQILERLEAEYPLAVEPPLRLSVVLRAAGRWRDAARVLDRLILTGDANPGVRLEYATLLRRSGRYLEAAAQLAALETEGFTEPDYYLACARLAEAQGRPDQAWTYSARGRAAHPRSSALEAYQAEWFVRQRQPERLAPLLAVPEVPVWIEPDVLAAAEPYLEPERLETLLRSPRWWLSWRWLPWERLAARSIAALEQQSDQIAAAGDLEGALNVLRPALDARLPDSDLWLRAARLCDLNRFFDASRQAYAFALHLGNGRFDAVVSELAQRARLEPLITAREFAHDLEQRPEDRTLRVGLILALLQAGEIAAAERALAPLTEADPFDPEARGLAAQVAGAAGRVRRARSLYESILRQDPLASDPRAARWALNDLHELGAAVGYEYAFLEERADTGESLDDWQEGWLTAWWRQPYRQTFTVEYRYCRRYAQDAQQLLLEYTKGLDRHWILRLHGGPALSGDLLPEWRIGAGINYRFADSLFGLLEAHYLEFSDLEAYQLVPALTWRWHPRGTLQGQVYLSENRLDSGSDDLSVTWLFRASWELARQSLVTVFCAVGDENSADPTRDLIGNDSLESAGIVARLGWQHRWSLQPAYRFERHERFDLHVVSLSLAYTY